MYYYIYKPASASITNTSTVIDGCVSSWTWHICSLWLVVVGTWQEQHRDALHHYVNYARYDTQCQWLHSRCWLLPWCIPGWITVTVTVLAGLPAYLHRHLHSVLNVSARFSWPYHWSPHQPPLATCSKTHWVQAGHTDEQTSAQSSTKLPRASHPCCRCTWLSSLPFRQHQSPDGAACQTVICRQPSFPGCCALCVEQSA